MPSKEQLMEEESRMREQMRKCWHVEVGGRLGFILNPVVTAVSALILLVFVIVCMVIPDQARKAMDDVAFQWVPEVWTWLYIISQDIWIVVLFYLMVSPKYGNMKLGKDDEDPEFSFATWFSMLFSAGVAVGLFYYSVAEPMWHYVGSGKPRFVTGTKGYGNSNEDAVHALMVSWYHWGLHGWIPYTTMGAVLAIMSYRRGFPMTIRYCLYPVLGDKCFGWMGDTIDILSIVTTVAGVCTSLGLGAMQVNQGLQRLNHGFYRGQLYAIPDEDKYSTPTCSGTGQVCKEGKESYGIQTNFGTQIAIIAVVTFCATASVLSGVNNGIVNLSRFNFALGVFLMLTVLFLGETWFILDIIVQTLGYYLWYIMKIGFWTDAFERLGSKEVGLGGAPDSLGGGNSWLTNWTIFYWGWWISWAPFVGTFLAKISRGRTVRQFIMGTLIVPTIYSFVWFGVFGAEGIRNQRMAEASGVCEQAAEANVTNCAGLGKGITGPTCASYSAQYSYDFQRSNDMGYNPPCVLVPGLGKCRKFKWTRKIEVGTTCVTSTTWLDVPCIAADGSYTDPTSQSNIPNTTGACASEIDLANYDLFPEPDAPECWVPVPGNVVCLEEQATTDIFFDQISSYGPRVFSDLLCVIGIIALVLYFVTSSDSGSLVVDIISANGHPDPPPLQRVFWSVIEGVTASALLAAGRNLPTSDGSLKALQSASLVTGLPYTFILFWCSQSLFLVIKEETGDIDKDRKSFSTFILSLRDFPLLLANTFVPGLGCASVIREIGGWPFHAQSPAVAFIVFSIMFQGLILASLGFLIASADVDEWCVVSGALYLGFSCFLGFLRTQFRVDKKILHGDMLTDQLVAMCLPMFTITQMQVQLKRGESEWEEQERAKQKLVVGAACSPEPPVEPPQEVYAAEPDRSLDEPNSYDLTGGGTGSRQNEPEDNPQMQSFELGRPTEEHATPGIASVSTTGTGKPNEPQFSELRITYDDEREASSGGCARCFSGLWGGNGW